MRSLASMQSTPAFTVARKRRAFGLDAPRPPDLRRSETAILHWLGARAPEVLVLRVAGSAGDPAPETASTLLLMLPGARMAVLRIDVLSGPVGPDTLALARQCRARRVPFTIVADVENVRAALRRLGVEPEENV